MSDWIEGTVTRVVDGDTFDLHVEWVGKANSQKYGTSERIRLASCDAPEVGSPGGSLATDRLRQRIGGKNVRCDIQARDTFGRLVCNVTIVPKRNVA